MTLILVICKFLKNAKMHLQTAKALQIVNCEWLIQTLLKTFRLYLKLEGQIN